VGARKSNPGVDATVIVGVGLFEQLLAAVVVGANDVFYAVEVRIDFAVE
jgi:hypothetical protein